MSNCYICPFCQQATSVYHDTHQSRCISFDNSNAGLSPNRITYDNTALSVHFFKCPSCERTSVEVEGKGKEYNGFHMRLIPFSNAKQFPPYIPQAILDDYEEACSIVDFSPKASATLARRCLQGMIRDFWGIQKSRLVDEINELNGKIPAAQWNVIDGVRRIGNIGAHMEKDVDLIIDIEPTEAQKLIKLIEHLLEKWYVARHEEEQLYSEIMDIDTAKQDERRRS